MAEQLAAIGMKVVLTARSEDALAAVVAGIKAKGGEAAAIKHDVKSSADTKAAFEFAKVGDPFCADVSGFSGFCLVQRTRAASRHAPNLHSDPQPIN
jgi:hypothetical protein